MNRLIICTILLLSGQAVLAEKLYRWIEPDGSITFSPTPPPAGVDYKAVDAASGANADALTKKPVGIQKPSILATSEHGLAKPQPPVKAAANSAPPEPAMVKQGLTYAPETSSRKIQPTTTTTVAELAQPATTNQAAIASSKKRRQCIDLSKRVISLERRLRSPLEPADMDNTVIAMARYQKSYDQHCIN